MALFNTGYKEHAKGVDYSSISNLKDLQEARQALETKILVKETELKFQYRILRELLNPVTYINRFVAKFASLENIVRCFCRGFTVVREILNESDRNKQNNQQ